MSKPYHAGRGRSAEADALRWASPKQPTPVYQKLFLDVDAQTHDVRRALVLDAQGNRNRFELGVPTVNQPVPAGTFNLAVPPGTKVVKVP